jgi:hypothetical protein
VDHEPYKIVYKFSLNNGQEKFFNILLNPETISIIQHQSEPLPDWAKLKYHQCKCCPLETLGNPYCPVAVNISNIVEEFKDSVSYDDCLVSCSTPERTYLKKTSIMEGISSILGIIMATSNCPIMDFFKPMARFHLPFSTSDETAVRVTSMFLLQQYLEYGNDSADNINLNKLEQHYNKVNKVNEGILKRISSLGSKDADKNAIIMLHSLSQIFSLEINYSLESIAHLFTAQNKIIHTVIKDVRN